ncbi:MAG: hypothetical protein M3169_18825 [Candidatus Eremiobacteraeota bacterium]|nr:hypothetical protein [Candidatus Eremiobacteraeota bacterium]
MALFFDRRLLTVIDFQRHRDRMIVAVALAIALHEIFLGFVHNQRPADDPERDAVATRIVFERPTPRPTPKPTPTPRPTPPPTPEPRVTPPPRATIAPVQQIAGRAKGRPARRHGGGAHKAIAKASSGTYANPKAAGAGTGTSTGQGSGNVPGTGGGLGGNGTGTSGNGNGAVNAETPCGVVTFLPHDAPRYSNGTAYETVRATVSFMDGHSETAEFPYKWVYPNGEQTDPWSSTNLKKPDFTIAMQLPPVGAATNLPPLILYIVKHTGPDGFTDLAECPKGRG